MKTYPTSKFYTFDQNNPGGSFDRDDDLAEYVIIEALNADDANSRASAVGIYFNGCEDEVDCRCCGDRWSEVREKDGHDTPMIYDKPASAYEPYIGDKGQIFCVVHYMDGRRVQLQA